MAEGNSINISDEQFDSLSPNLSQIHQTVQTPSASSTPPVVLAPWQIYQRILGPKNYQKPEESIDQFVIDKRALFSQLPEPRPDDTVQLDMLYGMIQNNLKNRLKREMFDTYGEFLVKAREIEAVLKEQPALCDNTNTNGNTNFNPNKSKPLRCTFCRYRGHSVEECRRKKQFEKDTSGKVDATTLPKSTSSTVSCYGCNTPGVVLRDCKKCTNQRIPQAQNIEWHPIMGTMVRNLPTVAVVIDGLYGSAHIDTAANMSVAGSKFSQHLLNRNITLEERMTDVTLADGSSKYQKVFITEVEVILKLKATKAKMMILPEAINNPTLLGIDFLEKANIVLNLGQRAWQYIDEEVWHSFELQPSN